LVKSNTALDRTEIGNGASQVIFERPFVKRFALCYLTVVCTICPVLPVCSVGVLWPNGWIDQDEAWHAGRPRPWPHCVRWGPSSPSPKGAEPSPIFGPFLLWPKGWMRQGATWYGDMASAQGTVLDGDRAPSAKGGGVPQFWAHVNCDQTAGWIKMALGMEVGLYWSRPHCAAWGPRSLPQKGGRAPQFAAHCYCAQIKRLEASRCYLVWR